MTNPTPTRLLVEARLGESLDEWVRVRRPLRVPSWRELAAEIADHTGVAVTGEAVRKWVNGGDDTGAERAA